MHLLELEEKSCGLVSCLEVDGFPKSCVQLHLQLCHFLADRLQLVLELSDLLLHPRRRYAEHLLRLIELHVEEGVPDFVAGRGPSACIPLCVVKP